MTKKRLVAQIKSIGKMSVEEGKAYRVKISTSSAPMKAKNFLYEACDVCLAAKDRSAAMASCGELLPSEVE